MSLYVNHDDVVAQLQAAGLVLDKTLTIDSGYQRWKVEGRDRERRGWSRLVGKVSAAGNAYIVGSFGVWEGNDDGKRRIEWSGKGDGASKLSAEEIACPVRLVWGTEDKLLPWPGAAARFRDDWLPQADWVVLDDVGHCPQLDVPLETAELIRGLAG